MIRTSSSERTLKVIRSSPRYVKLGEFHFICSPMPSEADKMIRRSSAASAFLGWSRPAKYLSTSTLPCSCLLTGVRTFQLPDIDLLHLQHRLHRPFGLGTV